MQRDEKLYPTVAIILVNYNGWSDTIECLESLLRSDYPYFQVIVVDNGSSNQSIEKITSWSMGKLDVWSQPQNPLRKYFFPPQAKPYPMQLFRCEKDRFVLASDNLCSNVDAKPLILIDSGCNLGFAGGNNVGIKFAFEKDHPDYFWLLNNDTVVDPRALSEQVFLAETLRKKKKKAGLIGSKLFYYHNSERLQAVGGRYQKWLALSHHIGAGERDAGQYDVHNLPMDYVIGASMFMSVDFVKDVGLMSEDYFLYYEELDWAKRGCLKGWQMGFCAKSIVYHKEGGSTGANRVATAKSDLADYYGLRNRFVFTRKYYPFFLIFVYFSMFVVFLRRIQRKKFTQARHVLKLILLKF